MEEEKIIKGILFLLKHSNEESPCGDGYTFLEIKEFLKINNSELEHKELKKLLEKMEEKGLIEERHFGGELGGRVDYSNENPGQDLIAEDKSLKEIWKFEI